MTTYKEMIERAIEDKNKDVLQHRLNNIKGAHAAKCILEILLDDDSYKTDEWIKSVLEMLP